MKAAYIEFRLDSSTMNTREFYASRQGTHRYLTKESVASALTYSEVIRRDKKDQWVPLKFDFDCTPASPVNVRTQDTVYKAGDQPDVGLLRYGHQELLMPGSVFCTVIWGDSPELWEGQVVLIGKKRAPAQIVTYLQVDVQPDTKAKAEYIMPIQVPPLQVGQYGTFIPLVFTARYAIIQVPLRPDQLRFVVNGRAVPLGIEGK